MLLKIGMSGPQVTSLIRELRKIGFALPQGSVFNSQVKATIEAFQVGKVDAVGNPLVVDGKVGPNTRWALDAEIKGLSPQISSITLPAIPTGGSVSGRAALQVALLGRELINGIPKGTSF